LSHNPSLSLRPTSLVARQITKYHGADVILDSVSLSLGTASRVGVVGPNGVGKTTLLRILAGLDRPDSGDVARVPAWTTVGYLPQEPERRKGETLLAHLARRTGVQEATALLESTAAALGGAVPRERAATGGTGVADPSAAYGMALDHYLALGGPDFGSRAEEVCVDVGLGVDALAVEMPGLSGGQAARASLAAVLLSRFDVFLLDEPTNDLDFSGLEILETFLRRLAGGFVVVSHDRAFLERTITSVLELDEHTHRATEYAGGWLAYLEDRAVARRHASDAYESYAAERQGLLDRARRQRQWAASGAARARRSPADNDKNRQFARIESSQKLAAKVRLSERALERLERESIDKPFEGWDLRMELPVAPNASEIAAWLRGAVVERGSFRLGPLDLEIRAQDRIGLTGPNGSGKTTLLGALLGRIPLVEGERGLGRSTIVGELDQARKLLDDERPLLEVFSGASGLVGRESRSLLAKFGLTAAHVRRPARTMSPGERTRAELALLMSVQTNFLVLDEPTNHLDLSAIEELEQALEGYEGTIILVTHDRRLLEAVELTGVFEVAPA
jgi:ATPase subunit of ABC transporter with duplicated ATPase domains